jgi:hypothetical protein
MGSQLKACPHCGSANTPWRQYCKICRQSLDGAKGLSLPAYVDETVKIYFSKDKLSLLAISSLRVEYQKRAFHMLTSWTNVKSLSHGFFGPYLLLWEPGLQKGGAFARTLGDLDNRQIPLAPFGYPLNADLYRDLRVFAPSLFS